MFKSYKHIDAFDLERNLKEENLLPKELHYNNFIAELLGYEEYYNDSSYKLYIPDEFEKYDSTSVFGIAVNYIKRHTSDEIIYIDVCW